MSLILIVGVLPYNIFIICQLSSLVSIDYKWTRIHGPDWNSVVKVPSYGQLRYDRWSTIAFGYILFFLFGTGTDAHNSYKRMLVSVGLGKIFPRLNVASETTTTSATPSTISFVRGWTNSMSAKAKGMFVKGEFGHHTATNGTRNSSSVFGTPLTARAGSLHPVSTHDPILPSQPHCAKPCSLFSRFFGAKQARPTLLPVSIASSVVQPTQMGKSPVDSIPPGVHTRAWSNEESWNQMELEDGVQVVREIRQATEEKSKDAKTDPCDWA